MEKLKMDLKYHKLSLLIRLIVNIAAILTVGVLIAIVVYILYRGIPILPRRCLKRNIPVKMHPLFLP